MARSPTSNIDPPIDALTTAITPLPPVDPATNPNLTSVTTTLSDADIIGLGEASHGTQEFIQCKHSLLTPLINNHTLRLLALETDYAATLPLNDYIHDGAGTPRDAMASPAFYPPYKTQALQSLLESLHEFNTANPTDSVALHGFDIQHSSAASKTLRSFFETIDPTVLDPIAAALDQLATPGFPDFTDDEALRTHLEARATVVDHCTSAFSSAAHTYRRQTSAQTVDRMQRVVWQLEQGYDQLHAIHTGRAKTGANIKIRDSAMAAQVQWLQSQYDTETTAIWGHNAHLNRDSFSGGRTRHQQNIPSLGRNLAMITDIDYYALGLILGCGTVTAAHDPSGEFRTYDIDDPPQGSIPEVFNRLSPDQWFLNLRELPPDSPIRSWFQTNPPHYDITGGATDSPVTLIDSAYHTEYDGIVFIRDTSAATPLDE